MQSEYRVGQKLRRNDGVIGTVVETTPKGRFVTVRWPLPEGSFYCTDGRMYSCKSLRKISTIIEEAPHVKT